MNRLDPDDLVAEMIARRSSKSCSVGSSSSSSSSSRGSEGKWIINESGTDVTSRGSKQMINRQYMDNTIQNTMSHNRREEIKDCWREHDLYRKAQILQSRGKRRRKDNDDDDDHNNDIQHDEHLKHDHRYNGKHTKPDSQSSSSVADVDEYDSNCMNSQREYWASLKANRALDAGDATIASMVSSNVLDDNSSCSSSSSSLSEGKLIGSSGKTKKSKKGKDKKKHDKGDNKNKKKKKEKKNKKTKAKEKREYDTNEVNTESLFRKAKKSKSHHETVSGEGVRKDNNDQRLASSSSSSSSSSFTKDKPTGATAESLSTNFGWKPRCGLCTFPKDRCKCRV